jgi:hypothetical protein
MDESRLRELAARVEDHRLDFKAERYSSNEELAKDLMVFANLLPPGSTAHILIGVRQRSDDAGEIVGCALDVDRDSNYQQKVAGKLNRTPQFTFYPFLLPEGEVGAFEITGVGERPYFPLLNVGKLRKFVPVKRQGSSTADASPDEVMEWVLEDKARLDSGFWLVRIPQSERDKVLLNVEMLTQSFKVVSTDAPSLPASLLDIDSSGAAARFQLEQYQSELSVPLHAISSVWRAGEHWQVVIDGYMRRSPASQLWEYQPRSRARPWNT